jgi:hypothetical protein
MSEISFIWSRSGLGHIGKQSSTVFVSIVGEDIDTIQKNTKALLDASKEVGLEVNPEKT